MALLLTKVFEYGSFLSSFLLVIIISIKWVMTYSFFLVESDSEVKQLVLQTLQPVVGKKLAQHLFTILLISLLSIFLARCWAITSPVNKVLPETTQATKEQTEPEDKKKPKKKPAIYSVGWNFAALISVIGVSVLIFLLQGKAPIVAFSRSVVVMIICDLGLVLTKVMFYNFRTFGVTSLTTLLTALITLWAIVLGIAQKYGTLSVTLEIAAVAFMGLLGTISILSSVIAQGVELLFRIRTPGILLPFISSVALLSVIVFGFVTVLEEFKIYQPRDSVDYEPVIQELDKKDPFHWFQVLPFFLKGSAASPDFDPSKTLENYPICYHEWYGLNIVDLGMLANFPYYEQAYLDEAFAKSSIKSWKIVNNSEPLPGQVSYLHFQGKDIDVISIRGTYSAIDGLQDVDLWFESIALQVYQAIVPGASWLLRDETVVSLVKELSSLDIFLTLGGNRFYYPEVVKYLDRLKQRSKKIVIVGHSLGGGVAMISGALTQLPAIGFSAPGITSSRAKFSIRRTHIVKKKTADQYTTNIIPHDDIVPKLDKQGGHIQHITCMQDPLTCHRLEKTLCELRHQCGDANFFSSLEKDFLNCQQFKEYPEEMPKGN